MSAAFAIPDGPAENPRAVIGANTPTDEPKTLSAFDLIAIEINDLYGEAKGWLDGEPIKTQAEADALAKLVDLLRTAEKAADELRKGEVAPLDAEKAAIQLRFHPLIGNTKAGKGKTVSALEACKAAQTTWLNKLDEELRVTAALARKEAEAKAAAAQAAIQAAAPSNLAEREAAEDLVREAKAAETLATRAEKAKPQSTGGARAMSLRTKTVAEVVNPHAYLKAVWAERHPDLIAFLSVLAQQQTDSGRRGLLGVVLHEDRRAV